MAMESTPDSGVEIRKAVVAPLLAPCFFKEAAAGKTPQEHRGMGMPNRAAFMTELNLPLPRWSATKEGFKKTLSRPPTNMPKRIYTEASSKRCQDSRKTEITISITVYLSNQYAQIIIMF